VLPFSRGQSPRPDGIDRGPEGDAPLVRDARWDARRDAHYTDRGVDRSDGHKISDVSGTDAIGNVPGTWVAFAATTFTMGSPATEPCRDSTVNKETEHQVTLNHGFEISTTEVTQDQFQAVRGYAPSLLASCGPSCPVESVTWSEGAAYCNALSQAKKLPSCYSCDGTGADVACETAIAYLGQSIYSCPGYRLPTEAEWEMAYRAGTTTAYYNGPNDSTRCTDVNKLDANANAMAWYLPNSTGTTHSVGSRAANPKGLLDMAGNVAEWCHDRLVPDLGAAAATDPVASTGGFMVFRGGSWAATAQALRAAKRSGLAPTSRGNYIGFRCVRSQ
jgi:formylglycine-generating enzyme required for sulfatase activity